MDNADLPSSGEPETAERRSGAVARTAAVLVLGVLLTAVAAIVYGAVTPDRPKPAPAAAEPFTSPGRTTPAAIPVDTVEKTLPLPGPSSQPVVPPPVSPRSTTRHPTTRATATTAKTTTAEATTAAPKSSSVAVWKSTTVNGTAVLGSGSSWATNRLRLTLGTNGDLTLADQGAVVWRTGTAGGGGTRLVMQGDGNLVLYDRASATLWSTRTDGNAGAALVLGADGSLTIRLAGRVLWSARG